MKKLWHWIISPGVMGAIALVGFGLAIYTGFFYERKPEPVLSIDALSKVFDLYRPVGGLEVSYGGQDLRSAKKTLWVLTATLKNVGRSEIRMGDYDAKAPLGFEVGGSVVVEKPTIKTSVEYLSKNLTVAGSGNLVTFSPVILEPEDSFEVTILLLGSESIRPTVTPVGKVSGVKSISLITPEMRSAERSLWSQAIESSSIWVHLLRVVIYIVGSLLAFALVAAAVAAVTLPFEGLRRRREEAARQRRIRSYRQHEGLHKESRYLIDLYVSEDKAGLRRVARYLHTHARRRSLHELLMGRIDEKEMAQIIEAAVPLQGAEDFTEMKLREAKLLDGHAAAATLSAGFEDAFADLCRYLDIDPEKLRLGPYDSLQVELARRNKDGRPFFVEIPGDVD